ncbi:ABC transporter permease [Cellulomonas fengjieae]|uniref:ABC transporter permease n=1 Tax=Cellulomonas fengjieae TaxID=2819978 RepID=UPI001AAF89FE|nr:ABC transporter permease [Cellulomonas fengjieae]MBO3101297.1 ABC transporter permease [Cellulomonas fengjieae]
MLILILAGLRHRAAALLSIVVAAGLGSALIVLSGAMFETGIRLVTPPERVSGADLVVIGDPGYTMLDREGGQTTDHRPLPERHRLSDTVVREAIGIEGVDRAVPVQLVETFARSGLRAATLTGQNWASASMSGLTVPEGPAPGPDEVVLTAPAAATLGVGPGDSLTLTVAGRTSTVEVLGVLGGTGGPATVFLADVAPGVAAGEADDADDATRGAGRIDALGVTLAAGADDAAVRDALGRLGPVRVLAGDHRGAAEDPAISASRTPTIVIGAVFGGIVLTVLATVTSGIVSLSVRQRGREISLLRATGATGRQAGALLVGEASIAGIVGAVLGLALGVPLAHALFDAMRAGGVVPDGLELRAGLVPFAVAVATCGLVVWLAARIAARPARRSRAIDALREADLPPARLGFVRGLLGVLAGLGAVALAVITTAMEPALVSATAGPAVLAGGISAVLLAPAHLRLGLVLLRPLLGERRGELARVNVRSRVAALSTVTGAAALVVGIGVGNLVSQTMLTTAAGRAQVETITAQALVRGPAGTGVELAAEIAALPEVGAVTPFVASGGWIERPYDRSHRDRPWPVRGLDGAQAERVLSNRLVDGELAALTGRSIALPARTAEALGVRTGDTVDFRFGDGAGAELRVVATYDDLPGYENLLLPADLLAAHTTARTPGTLLVSAGDGTSADRLATALDEVVADHPAVVVGDRDDLEHALQEGLGVNALINTLMLLVVLAYAMVAAVNTVAVSTLGRRRELALLRLAGATRRQVRTLLLTETGIAAVAGLGAGLVVACAAVAPTAVVVGADLLGPLPLAALAAGGLAVALITLPITAAATRRALSGRPADVLTRAA